MIVPRHLRRGIIILILVPRRRPAALAGTRERPSLHRVSGSLCCATVAKSITCCLTNRVRKQKTDRQDAQLLLRLLSSQKHGPNGGFSALLISPKQIGAFPIRKLPAPHSKPDFVQASIANLEKSVGLDPTYAPAWDRR